VYFIFFIIIIYIYRMIKSLYCTHQVYRDFLIAMYIYIYILEEGGGQRHAPAALYLLERPGTHCTGGLVGPRAGLDRCGKFRHHRDSIPVPPSP
jgi:hypothetical protein